MKLAFAFDIISPKMLTRMPLMLSIVKLLLVLGLHGINVIFIFIYLFVIHFPF